MKKKLEITPAIHTGIESQDRKKITEGLSKLLAGTYTLYLKTQKFHWNVTGPFFESLHKMFELSDPMAGVSLNNLIHIA